MLKAIVHAAALAAAVPAVAQSEPGTYVPPPQPPPPSQAYPPPQQPAGQQPAAAQPPPAQGQAGQPPSASGTGSSAPAAPGAGSQQVVVNPPQGAAQAPPPASTTVVTPPAAPPPAYGQGEVVVRERRDRNPMATIATDAAYGGVAGLAVGVGVALIDRGDNWGRDLSVSAGAGILIGAIVGVAQAANDARNDQRARDRYALSTDGLGSPARDPVIRTPPAVAWAGRF